jgi:SAM-dependent methyltransferase
MLHSMGAAATITNFWYDNPPRLGSDAEFSAARQVFERAGYNYANLCARLGVGRLYEYKMPAAAETLAQPVTDALDVLSRVFGHGLHLERAVVERYLTAEGRAALCALHLIEADPDAPEMDFAPAVVLPCLDALTMTDRFCAPSGESIDVAADAVYPAIFDNTYNFVSRLPQTPCEALLDLGTGTGVAAICQARFARRVWATDITARAAYFAGFNGRLNGCDNVETAAGDLYAPVRGMTFDRIVSQPPYIAVEADKIAYRDGGKDGEQVFRRIVEGLPEFLRPGGTCYALLMATDREGETFEQRVRKWLGWRADEFDIFLGCDVAQEPMEFLRTAQKIPVAEREYRRVLYQETHTCAVLYCSIAIRRKRKPGTPVTARTFLGKDVRGEDLDFQLAWNAAAVSARGAEMLWNSRPRLGAHCELAITHRVREGRLVPEEFELRTTGRFVSKGKTPPWAAQIVAECDGSVTWGERFAKLREEGRLPAGMAPEEFGRMLAVLVSTGVLEVSQESLFFDKT